MSGRKLTTAVTLVVLILIVCGMAVYGFKQLTKPLPPGPQVAREECTEAEKQVQEYLRRNQVQVSVFNASKRSGLAGRTLDRVEGAGFRAGNAGNAPRSAKVRRAVVWTTKPDDPAAQLVAKAFGAGTKVRVTTTDLGPGIDVLIGDRFKGLAPKAPRRIKLATPIETCIPVA